MAKLAWGFLAADLAGAVEAGPGFDHQLTDHDRAVDLSGGDDFQALGIDITGKAATDHDPLGIDLAFHAALFTNRDFAFGLDRAFDPAVDMETVA
jgi:hypothetical protein